MGDSSILRIIMTVYIKDFIVHLQSQDLFGIYSYFEKGCRKKWF